MLHPFLIKEIRKLWQKWKRFKRVTDREFKTCPLED